MDLPIAVEIYPGAQGMHNAELAAPGKSHFKVFTRWENMSDADRY